MPKEKTFEEEMKEICDGVSPVEVSPACAVLPLVEGVEMGNVQTRGVKEKRDGGRPGKLNFGKKGVQSGVHGGNEGFRGKSGLAVIQEEMPAYGDGSKPLHNTRHEHFAKLASQGKPDYEAYQIAFGCSQETAMDRAYLLRKDVGINRRIAYLLERMTSGSILSAKERLEFLASVVRTPVGEVNEFSPLAQEVTYEESEKGSRTKVKMPNKLEALQLDARLRGELDGVHGDKPALRLRLVAQSGNGAGSIAAELESF